MHAIGSDIDEGFVDIDGDGFYVIPNVDRMAPFLMSIVSDSDHWMFVSSRGGLTAGRVDTAGALFPYETDDRLHQAGGVTGPVTAIRPSGADDTANWRPFRDGAHGGIRRNLYKSVVGNQVIFEEAHTGLGLVFRYRWANSERFGFVRTVSLSNTGEAPARLDVLDGLLNLLPHGLTPALYAQMSNLTNAYKRSEVIDPETRLAVYTLEARVVDRPEPAEALRASTVWSVGWDAGVCVDLAAVAAFEAGSAFAPHGLVTGRPGAYLLSGSVHVEPGDTKTWHIVADVAQDHLQVAGSRRWLPATPGAAAEVEASVRRGTAALNAIMAGSDALQRTGDRVATAHQFANVTYNVMRGGTPLDGYRIRASDFARFVASRNRVVAGRHRMWLEALPETIERFDLLDRIEALTDPQFTRLGLEYLPFGFSRRHGDPSRPWNSFSIRVRDAAGEPALRYEGNWRDIFQNWEALCLSFPEFLPGVVSVFVNASTPDGFNPYRITREGVDWEIPDPDDPWSNIGYWGDHQIVYLERLLEATRRYLPGALEALLDRAWFSYADVPYRLAGYDEMVRDPKSTVRYDPAAASRAAARVEELGGDGRLLWGSDRTVHLVTLVEKLLVPALSKLSNFIPGGGIWMNTQRPEWNDANNALVGYGVSMVTLYQLRRYVGVLRSLATQGGLGEVQMSIEVANWLAAVSAVFRGNGEILGRDIDDRTRKVIMDELGWAFVEYRSRVYASGLSGTVAVNLDDVDRFCSVAIDHLDDTIRRNRRDDGLYHSYNLVHFSNDGSAAAIEPLYEMLEGQMAVLGSGVLGPEEQADVLDALFASAMYRKDQRSFMLYPARRLPAFVDKNIVPGDEVERVPLLRALADAGEPSIIGVDADGRYRFNADLFNEDQLERALEQLAVDDRWRDLVAAGRVACLDTYERVFRHRAFTGRSGSMYGYEGIGSVYWHMVAKLLVAVQEAVVAAEGSGASPATLERLTTHYWAVRSGLGFNKAATEYGAFPTDPYSHTPAHAGAQQPGMTGQVKEELLTRPLELGVRVMGGAIVFDPVLLRPLEVLGAAESWETIDADGELRLIELPAGSLGLTVCQVPVVVATTTDEPAVEVRFVDGSTDRHVGLSLDLRTSAEVFARSGRVQQVTAFVPDANAERRS
jgi:hypothetical protein